MSEFPSAAIANAFVDLAGHHLPQMKMHKLTYIAHGWNLAISGEPLVADTPEAWDNGPVFRLIWDRIRDFGLSRKGKILRPDGTPYAANLSDQQKSVLNHVWKKYSKYNQFELSDMTHKPGTPWTKAYFGNGRNAPLSNELIRRHYRELAMAGRG